MFDLPPTRPVIPDCAAAVVESWQDAEACLLKLGFQSTDAPDFWIQVEKDYWGAIELSHRNYALTDAEREALEMHEAALEQLMESIGHDPLNPIEPFLTTGVTDSFSGIPGEIHRFFAKGVDIAAVLLDDGSSTSITLFSTQPWEGFETFFYGSNPDLYWRENKPAVQRIDSTKLTCWTIAGVEYSEEEVSDCPAFVELSMLHTIDFAFEAFLGRSSSFEFEASFTSFRE